MRPGRSASTILFKVLHGTLAKSGGPTGRENSAKGQRAKASVALGTTRHLSCALKGRKKTAEDIHASPSSATARHESSPAPEISRTVDESEG